MKAAPLRRKLVATMFLTSIVALVLACGLLLGYELRAAKLAMSRSLSVLAKTVAANSSALLMYDSPEVGLEILSATRNEPDIVAACFYDARGRLYVAYPTNAPARTFPLSPGVDGLEFAGSDLTIFEPVVEKGTRAGTLFIREDLRGMYHRFSMDALVVLVILGGSSVVALLLSRMFQRRISEPILALAATARHISEEKDYTVRAHTRATAEELVLLNQTFNEMLNQIQERDRSLQQAAEILEARVAERTRSLEDTTRQLYDFCYSIAHDLKAPIRAQAAYARLLLEDFGPQLGAEASEFAARILDAAERQSRLVNDLLAHVSLGRSDLPIIAVDLASTAQAVMADLRVEAERQQAQLDFTKVSGTVLANPASLHLVLMNLASNALKFVPRGSPPQVRLWTEENGDYIRLSVRDNGIGIAPQHLGKLFGIFQRLHTREEYPGTGIGLAIVKRAAERMNGRVGVDSVPGKGSCFWIELPRAKSDEPTKAGHG